MSNGHIRRRINSRSSNSSIENDRHLEDETLFEVIIEAPDWPADFKESYNDEADTAHNRFFHWGPIVATLFTLIISMTVYLVHIRWCPLFTFSSALKLFLFLFFNYSTLRNLGLAASVGPGYVPKSWRPPHQEDKARLQFCKVCNGFKTPRSHHCSRCNRCVLKMDHHCPWINNCVGHRNHAFFVRFLASGVAGSIYAIVLMLISLHHVFYREWYIYYGRGDEPIFILTLYSFILCVFSLGLALGVVVAVGFLLFTQIKIILRNRTGIEDYIVGKAQHRRSRHFHYPYDLGWRRNLSEVLGTWNGMTKGNGVWWPLRSPSTQFSFSEEQLVQKKLKRENAIDYLIVKNFPGGICKSISLGFTIWACQPCSDETRIAIIQGERWSVTRRRKHWLYGIRKVSENSNRNSKKGGDQTVFEQDPHEEDIQPRGWFPRICAEKA